MILDPVFTVQGCLSSGLVSYSSIMSDSIISLACLVAHHATCSASYVDMACGKSLYCTGVKKCAADI